VRSGRSSSARSRQAARTGSGSKSTAPRKALAFDQEQPETLWSGRRDAVTIVRRDPATLSPAAARFAFLPGGHPQGYADCFDAFVAEFYDAVRSGSAPAGMPSFADGLRAAQITDAVLVSSREERWVDVETAVDAVPR
jgi:predicted dehydrogenase